MTEPVISGGNITYTLPKMLVNFISKLCEYGGFKILKDTTLAERSYNDANEDGGYFNTCTCCGRQFTGFKRMVTCKACRVDEVTQKNNNSIEQLSVPVIKEIGDLYREMAKIDDNWNANGRSRDVAVMMAFEIMKNNSESRECTPLIIQYLSLGEAMGYKSGDQELSPEEYVAELKRKADLYDKLTARTSIEIDAVKFAEYSGAIPTPVFNTATTSLEVTLPLVATYTDESVTINNQFSGQAEKWVANEKSVFIKQPSINEEVKETPHDGYSPWF